MRTLVVGGTAGTAPPIIDQLLQRGYAVSSYRRGIHELDELPPEIEHVHAEPHFDETISRDLAGRSFDLAVAAYRRIRYLAEAPRGKAPRLITIGGYPVMKGWLRVRDPRPRASGSARSRSRSARRPPEERAELLAAGVIADGLRGR